MNGGEIGEVRRGYECCWQFPVCIWDKVRRSPGTLIGLVISFGFFQLSLSHIITRMQVAFLFKMRFRRMTHQKWGLLWPRVNLKPWVSNSIEAIGNHVWIPFQCFLALSFNLEAAVWQFMVESSPQRAFMWLERCFVFIYELLNFNYPKIYISTHIYNFSWNIRSYDHSYLLSAISQQW